MHSSRMRTVCLLSVFSGEGCIHSRGSHPFAGYIHPVGAYIPLADLGGGGWRAPHAPPRLYPKIFSISCSFSEIFGIIIDWRTPAGGLTPPPAEILVPPLHPVGASMRWGRSPWYYGKVGPSVDKQMPVFSETIEVFVNNINLIISEIFVQFHIRVFHKRKKIGIIANLVFPLICMLV